MWCHSCYLKVRRGDLYPAGERNSSLLTDKRQVSVGMIIYTGISERCNRKETHCILFCVKHQNHITNSMLVLLVLYPEHFSSDRNTPPDGFLGPGIHHMYNIYRKTYLLQVKIMYCMLLLLFTYIPVFLCNILFINNIYSTFLVNSQLTTSIDWSCYYTVHVYVRHLIVFLW